MSDSGNTTYPILFVHGMGFRDNKLFNYWGRIPKIVKQNGQVIYYGKQDANGSIVGNATQLAKRLDEILIESNHKKVHIIAHSKGGLEARYLISSLGYHDKIASLTTLSTPHNGSRTMDVLLKFPNFIIKFGCFFVDVWNRICGDKAPHTFQSIYELKTTEMAKFNKKNPDHDHVFYQSYSFVMKNIFSDILLAIPYMVVYMIEGPNDGLLAPSATKWTNYQGIVKSNGRRGISHNDEVDLRRHRFTKKQGEGISDIVELYQTIIRTLLKQETKNSPF